MTTTLDDLPDDLLIDAIAFLSVPDILFLRQTCTRFNALTRLEIVWINAFKFNILSNDYPCPLDDTDLEQRTCHAYRLATRWLADSPLTPASEIKFTSSSISLIKFIPGRQHKWLLIVSNIRTVLAIWDIACTCRCSEWSPKGGKLFTRVILNEDPESEVSMAVVLDGPQRMLLLHLDDDGTLHEIHDIDLSFRPVSMAGDIIALSDDVSKTLIYNWKTKERAYLDDGGNIQHNHCSHVIFAPTTVVVVCINMVYVYAWPPLFGQNNTPIMRNPFSLNPFSSDPFSSDPFGWTELTTAISTTPKTLLTFTEDQVAREGHLFQLYSLASVLPTLLFRGSSHHGVSNVVLGKRRTAVWIDPESFAFTAVFPGSLNPTTQVRIHELCLNAPKNFPEWNVLDYDEELGRIALSSRSGEVTIIQL